ncbi:MAG: hydrogenase maturation nickel metallochaperone HypA [Planctomycetota bacterium]|jgi:hydrogenase nickel incorporation protein HypA/HybF
MHEFSIATALIEQVLAVAKVNQLDTVREVELDVGALQLVVPEALEAAFEAVCEGTPAAGAKLIQQEVPPKARCRDCGRIFIASIDRFQCEHCGEANTELVEGREIILKSISGDPVSQEGGLA